MLNIPICERLLCRNDTINVPIYCVKWVIFLDKQRFYAPIPTYWLILLKVIHIQSDQREHLSHAYNRWDSCLNARDPISAPRERKSILFSREISNKIPQKLLPSRSAFKAGLYLEVDVGASIVWGMFRKALLHTATDTLTIPHGSQFCHDRMMNACRTLLLCRWTGTCNGIIIVWGVSLGIFVIVIGRFLQCGRNHNIMSSWIFHWVLKHFDLCGPFLAYPISSTSGRFGSITEIFGARGRIL
jgi:hypothetical protein